MEKCGNVIDKWEVEVTPGGQRTATLNSQWQMLKHNDPRVGVHSVRQLRAVLELISSVANKCGNVINNWEVEVTPDGQRIAALVSQSPMLKAHNHPRVGGPCSRTAQGCTGLSVQCPKQ